VRCPFEEFCYMYRDRVCGISKEWIFCPIAYRAGYGLLKGVFNKVVFIVGFVAGVIFGMVVL